jgi:tripartite-type tricarboxylate transporter receptor subunit TctC
MVLSPVSFETSVSSNQKFAVVFRCHVGGSLEVCVVKFTRRDGLRLMGGALAAPAIGRTAWAATWPSKPIQAMVPLGAGSTTDIVGRIVSAPLAELLGQPIVVENRGGAGGTLGCAAVARSEPDGHTILINSSQHTVAPAVYPKMSYDVARDFAAVTSLGSSPNVAVVPADKGIKTLKELVAAGKAKPGGLLYSSAGVGSGTHLTAEIFRLSGGFDAVHVPFRGMQDALVEVMTGRVDFACATIAAALPYIQDGKLIALAVMTKKRSSILPDVPTSIEAGFANSDYSFWTGMFLPAKAPREVVDRLYQETRKALSAPGLMEKLAQVGVEPMPVTPAEFDAQIKAEVESNLALIKSAGLKLN